jgi:hypothetical protein
LPASSETYRLLWSGFRSDCIADVSEEFRHSCGSFAPDSPLEGSGFEHKWHLSMGRTGTRNRARWRNRVRPRIAV